MPAPINYQNMAIIQQTTLSKYFGRPGDKYKLIDLSLPARLIGARMLKRSMLMVGEGQSLQWPLLLSRSQVSAWTAPYQKATMRTVQAPTWANAPWRFLFWSVMTSFQEKDLNSGEKEVLIDIMQLTKHQVAADRVQIMEDSITAIDGNYAHDGVGSDYLLPFGLMHLYTPDGLHVTGASRAVFGINPTTYAQWRNRYVNPFGGSDGLAGMASVLELRKSLDRIMAEMDVDSPQLYGSLAKDAVFYHDNDSDRATPSNLSIFTGRGTSIDYRDTVFTLRDDKAEKNQYAPRPVYKGVEVIDSPNYKIDSTYGYGYDSSGNVLWTDRGGNWASGSFKGYEYCHVINHDLTKVAVHKSHAPAFYGTFRPEGMAATCSEGDFWCQTITLNRKYGGGFIGPYEVPSAA